MRANADAVDFLRKNRSEGFLESYEKNNSIAKRNAIGLQLTSLSTSEEDQLKSLIFGYFDPRSGGKKEKESHLEALKEITAEVKSITKQSILLHGERIKRAQNLLRDYREGAFSRWLMQVYGNRQTPYSILRYYEFYLELPEHLRQQLQRIPKKAAYTLASRSGDVSKKIEIVGGYNGERQREVMRSIQRVFPVKEESGAAKSDSCSQVLFAMEDICLDLEARGSLNKKDKARISKIIDRLSGLKD